MNITSCGDEALAGKIIKEAGTKYAAGELAYDDLMKFRDTLLRKMGETQDSLPLKRPAAAPKSQPSLKRPAAAPKNEEEGMENEGDEDTLYLPGIEPVEGENEEEGPEGTGGADDEEEEKGEEEEAAASLNDDLPPVFDSESDAEWMERSIL